MTKYKPLPSQEKLNEIFFYDKRTGDLFRKKNGKYTGSALVKPDGVKYYQVHCLGRNLKAHRIIWKMVTGQDPDVIDHINGNGLDNRWINLRNVTNQENGRNCKRSKNNTSGTTGVSWAKDSRKWLAQIMIDGKNIRLGLFKDKNDAIFARRNAERMYGFHPNHDRG